MSRLPDCHKAVSQGIPQVLLLLLLNKRQIMIKWRRENLQPNCSARAHQLLPMLNDLRDFTTLQFPCLHVTQDFVCTVENKTHFFFFTFNFLENQTSFLFAFYTAILVPTPSFCPIPSTSPPAPPPIQSSENVRHFALGKVQGPPYYIQVEQGIHPKRMNSPKASICSRDKY